MVLGVLFGMLMAIAARGDDSGVSEYQVKAAFLYNFAKFVKWPDTSFADTNSPIVIGILGENPFGDALTLAVKGRTANGRPITVRALTMPAEMKTCHIVFISQKPRRNLGETLALLNNSNVLTVSEGDHFIESGGMINFFIDSTKVRFEINDQAATKAGLTISSKLLNCAKKKDGSK